VTVHALNRFLGKANVVFCAGHVESPTLQFLFEDTSDAALVRWNRDHLSHREKLSPQLLYLFLNKKALWTLNCFNQT
jgi:hypothetical protein